MKKLITLILAGLLTASCVLVSCTPKTAVEKDGKDSKADNAVEEGGFSIGTPEQLLNNTKFNADFEKKLAEVVEMKDLDKEILLNISGVPVSAGVGSVCVAQAVEKINVSASAPDIVPDDSIFIRFLPHI